MTNVLLSLIISFAVTAIAGPLFIPFLRRLKFGQNILDIGPSWHKSKQGTPTMGGLMMILGVCISFAFFGYKELSAGDYRTLAVVIVCIIFGIIGFADDFIKSVKKRNLGLTALQKLILQTLTASGFLFFLVSKNYISTSVFIPFVNINFNLGWSYYIFALLFIVYTVNSVNLTDGLDGLAASIMVPITALFAILAQGHGANGLSVVSTAVTGSCLGFLIYNSHPAKVFMGDTGSLFLGGAICAIAFALDIPLIILIAGFIYLFEALSVVIQVISFKLTGKRVFKMSPIHHHFELSGWKEPRIVFVFTSITVILCIIAYLGFMASYTV